MHTTPGTNTFQGLIEEAHRLGSSWRPLNPDGEVAAGAMRKVVRDIPHAMLALADMWKAMAAQCTDEIAMEIGTSDLLAGLEEYMRRPIPAMVETAEAMDRPHDDDVRRVRTGDARLAAWDWKRNHEHYGEM